MYPLVIADNERYLREQPFLRDALIVVAPAAYAPDSVDVIVLTRDAVSYTHLDVYKRQDLHWCLN